MVKVNLWYDGCSYRLRLGDILSIRTSLSSTSASNKPISTRADQKQYDHLLVNIFPDREKHSHLQVTRQRIRTTESPDAFSGHDFNLALLGLVRLKSFFELKGPPSDCKILVAVSSFERSSTGVFASLTSVEELGPDADLLTDQSTPSDNMAKIRLKICDQSGVAKLTLAGALAHSITDWEMNHPLLLISSPGRQPGSEISIMARTCVEIDPDIDEARALRTWMQCMQRNKYTLNEDFPGELFDGDRLTQEPMQLHFTLASLVKLVYASPATRRAGLISLVLAKLNLVSSWKQKKLFMGGCCGIVIYANSTNGTCQRCGRRNIHLRINANIVAEMADETGVVSSWPAGGEITPNSLKTTAARDPYSQLLWTDEAWTQLLGRSPEQFEALDDGGPDPKETHEKMEKLKYLEDRLAFMRVILSVCWTGERLGGRLAMVRVVA